MLGIYRLGIFIPAPGVDRVALGDFFANNQGTLLGLYDMFSGGALEQFSVFVWASCRTFRHPSSCN